MKKVLYLGNALKQHGFSPTSVETLSPLLQELGFDIISGSSKRRLLSRLMDMFFLTIKHRKEVGVVLIDTYSTKAFWYAYMVSILCKIIKIKYMPILHGGDLLNRLKVNPRFCRQIFKHSHVNIAPSKYFETKFKENGFENTIMIPNTINIDFYQFKKREQLSPNLLWVRSMASIYRPHLAIEILKELQKKYPQATLTMVGPEKDVSINELKTYAKQLNVVVEFTGKLIKKEWTQLALKHDIFLNTTSIDNSPISVIEAMALGLPVVSTNVGGLPYLLNHQEDAILIEDATAINFCHAIEAFIDNNDLATKLAINAKHKVDLFDWFKIKEKWIQLLTEIL